MRRSELPNGTAVIAEEFYDTAIIGLSNDGRAIYSYRGIITALMESEGMTEDQAVEYIDYNFIGFRSDRVIIADILNED